MAPRDPVDFKASVPVPFCGRIFVRLVVGRERRNLQRLEQEGQMAPARMPLLYAVACYVFAANAAFGAFCVAYLVKAMLGINLLPGPSPFHPLYAAFVGSFR